MAVLAVLMLTMIMVETLAKPVPGDWNHEINFEQDTLHPELQLHQNTASDDFRQIQHEHLQHVGQNMQQVGHNQEYEDFEQNHNELHDIEQVGHQQAGHNQEFEDFKQNHNEQQDIEQVGHQQVGHNQQFEDYEQNQNEQHDIEQDTRYLQESQGYQHREQTGQNYDQVGQPAYDQHTSHNDNEIIQLLGSDKYRGQQDDQGPVVEPRLHYEELDTEYVTTEEPGLWKKFGHKISHTYNVAKNKANDIVNKIKETVG